MKKDAIKKANVKKKSEKQIMELYNKYLITTAHPLVGDKITYLSTLNKAGNKLFGVKYKGTFPSDMIPLLNDISPYCIVNLDNSKMPGSHWVAVAKIKGKNKSIVYDSFGRRSKKILPPLHGAKNGTIIDADLDAEQTADIEDCGARCLAFLYIFDKHGPDNARLI